MGFLAIQKIITNTTIIQMYFDCEKCSFHFPNLGDGWGRWSIIKNAKTTGIDKTSNKFAFIAAINSKLRR
jgi:hypothetical protein